VLSHTALWPLLRWAEVGQKPNAAPASLPLPPPRGWGENRRKARRLMDQDKDSLRGKAKGAQVSKVEREIHSLLPIIRQMSGQFPRSRASACITVAWDDKNHKHECPPILPPFHGLLLLNILTFISWGQFSPSNLLLTPSLLIAGEGCGREKAFTLWKYCSATLKTSVLYQHCFSHKCKSQHHIGYYEEC